MLGILIILTALRLLLYLFEKENILVLGLLFSTVLCVLVQFVASAMESSKWILNDDLSYDNVQISKRNSINISFDEYKIELLMRQSIFLYLLLLCNFSLAQTKVVNIDAKLKKTEHVLSDVIKIVPKGSTITLVKNIGKGVYRVKYGNTVGYMNDLYWQPATKNTKQTYTSTSTQHNKEHRSQHGNTERIKMTRTESGLFEVPVLMNGVLVIYFIIDSGASEVSISPDVALTLLRTRTIGEEDWLEGAYYRFADGTIAKSERFKLDMLEIGNQTLYNIEVSISSSIEAPMLLGQNVLSKLGKITFDYSNNILEITK